jgi:hypothetical protein
MQKFHEQDEQVRIAAEAVNTVPFLATSDAVPEEVLSEEGIVHVAAEDEEVRYLRRIWF